MNRTTGVILLIAIVALGGIAFYINANPEVASNPTETAPASTSRPLWTIDPTSITGLTVSDSASGSVFQAELQADGRWRIAEPEAADADSATMLTLVNTVASLYITRDIAEATSLTEFGLDSPSHAVEVRTAAGETYRMTIGQKAVNGFSYYVLPQGSTIPVLISSASIDTLLTLPTDPPIAEPTPTPTAGTLEPLPSLPAPATASP